MKAGAALNRLFLLAAGLLAAYQVAVGIEGFAPLPLAGFTVAFGVLLLAALLMLILGFDILENPLVVIVSSLIPLSLSLGLVAAFFPAYGIPYLVFAALGLPAIAISRFFASRKTAALILSVVHSVAGLVICFLPLALALTDRTPPGFALVGVGGALIGVGGLLLSFLKAGKPILSKEKILAIFPGLLFLTTAAFVAGFGLG